MNKPGLGKIVMGRSAVNQKGPQAAMLTALHAIHDARRKLPVNLILVAEKEKEIGSPHFSQIVRRPEMQAKRLEMPIVMLTTKNNEEDVIRKLELDTDDYVTKPFNIHELLARAKTFLRRRDSITSNTFTFGDYQLELDAHKFFKNGQKVFLTNKEFRLLKFFTKHPEHALTRDQILDAVWSHDIIMNDRSMDRCVTTLRAKIEPDPQHPDFIHTIRDIGYRFKCS